jgi:hypothetical protein
MPSMKSVMRPAVLVFGLLAWAGTAAGADAAAPPAETPREPVRQAEREEPASPVTAPARRAEPRVEQRIIEDDHVRIEELRVRGQTRRITVQSKVQGAREYEIIVGHGGRDPSQDRGNAGRAAWRIFGF